MKLNGHKYTKPNRELCVIPRGSDEPDAVFIAEAILTFDDFERLQPVPSPPKVVKADNEVDFNHDDPTYRTQLKQFGERRVAWMVIMSLKATPGLEWETVDFENPKTWVNYRKELRDGCFSHVEIQRIEAAAFAVNSLDENRVKQARENFVRGQAAILEKSSGQTSEPNSTQSGEDASE